MRCAPARDRGAGGLCDEHERSETESLELVGVASCVCCVVRIFQHIQVGSNLCLRHDRTVSEAIELNVIVNRTMNTHTWTVYVGSMHVFGLMVFGAERAAGILATWRCSALEMLERSPVQSTQLIVCDLFKQRENQKAHGAKKRTGRHAQD